MKMQQVARSVAPALMLMLVFPASTNYKLHDFGFGGGGTRDSSSTNYRLDALLGEPSGSELSGTTYNARPGLIFTRQANVPPAPTFTNPSSYYNRLHLTIAAGGNPSDALFAVAISTDAFSSDTKYVQSDNTVGAILGTEDYQTYAAWGGGAGEDIVGLTSNTTYTVKVKAMHGDFTETDWGPTASAATVGAQLSFDIDVAPTDTDTDPPFAINLGSLTASTVVTGSDKIWIDLTTNGASGGRVYIVGSNVGLLSSAATYTISSATANLASANEGFGAQGSSATQSSGGPLSISAPYNVSSDNVGVLDTSIRDIFTTNNPITSGRGSFLLKAKSSSVTPAAADYAETLTVIASASF